MANLSMCFGPLRLRCYGATAKSLADELGMEPGDLLLTDAASGENVLIPQKYRDQIAKSLMLVDVDEGLEPGSYSTC